MAPELVMQCYDEKADVWSVGMLVRTAPAATATTSTATAVLRLPFPPALLCGSRASLSLFETC